MINFMVDQTLIRIKFEHISFIDFFIFKWIKFLIDWPQYGSTKLNLCKSDP